MKIKNIKRLTDSLVGAIKCVFTLKNRPADPALSSRVQAIAVRAWGVFLH